MPVDPAVLAAVSAEVVRRNRRLGLILGAISLATLGLFFILFFYFGLPKDPKITRERAQAAGIPDQGTR